MHKTTPLQTQRIKFQDILGYPTNEMNRLQ